MMPGTIPPQPGPRLPPPRKSPPPDGPVGLLTLMLEDGPRLKDFCARALSADTKTIAAIRQCKAVRCMFMTWRPITAGGPLFLLVLALQAPDLSSLSFFPVSGGCTPLDSR